MLHKNETGKKVKVRLSHRKTTSTYEWRTILPGETVEMNPQDGEVYGFTPVEEKEKEPEKGDTKKDTMDATDQDEYWAKIVSIKGIGAKTADQIVKDYPTEADLLKAVQDNEKIHIFA